uniref:hypothetical protein n=1 Tax=Clostridium sp. TaxID=1506 RepID=UPI00261C2FAD
LAHLASLKVEFDLAISGNSEMIDVKIAKEIADKLGMEIQISNENIKEINKNTLRELFISSDGVYGVFSRYRLHNKNIMLEKSGSELEFGGAAGEFYKNGFINQDFPFYNIGKVNKNKFYKLKINPSNWGKEYLTDNIIEQKEQMKNKIIKTIFDNKDDRKSNLYFKAGHKIMRHRIITISNSSNLSIPSISPFTEVDMMKLTYKKNPWKLEINKWQRNEVSKFFPKIASIKTDRGLTLQNNFLKVLREFFTSYLFLLKIALKRTLLSKKEKNINKRLDIYIVGRKMKQFEEAMDKCKELNVINQDCDIERIPDILADRLMTIGLVFLYS